MIVGLLASAAAVVALARWLRVSQREHYLPGSCITVAVRWLRCRPVNAVILVVGTAACLGAVLMDGSESGGAALLAAAAGATFPIPMSLFGRDQRLRLTRRAVMLAGLVVVLSVGITAVSWLAGTGFAGPALVAFLMPLLVDAGARLAAPLERRAMNRHRNRAAAKLRRIDPTVIAVTGSWGKTSTKNHIAQLLSGSVSVVASPASFNNIGGLARTINDHMSDDCEVFVAEMGMYGPGEIRALCEWIPPDIAIISSVGPMHLERAGSIEAIVAAKSEILEPAKQAILWVENPHLAELASGLDDKLLWRVGSAGTPDLDVEVRATDAGSEVLHHGRQVGTCPRESGVHPENLGCAVAAALAFGLDERVLGPRIAALTSPVHRGSAVLNERGAWVVDDTFNSNPVGAARALAALVRATPGSRRVVVTPGMVELGPGQHDENARFAAEVVAQGATLVIVGWTNRRALLDGAGRAASVCVRNRAAARDWVRAELQPRDGVLWENDLPDHYP